jgi:voltage-gated potassium channel Kch
LGAIAVYLLIPIAFFYVFYTIDVLQPTAFFGQVEPTSSFMYFSLTTVTTVGYGDLVAVSQPGRLMANFEAVIGQVYLVTFVGLLIGLLTQQNREA